MSSEDLMSLSCAQALLDLYVSSAAKSGCPDDMDGDGACSSSDIEHSSHGVVPIDASLGFDYLLREELVFERNLAERGNLIDVSLRNGLVFKADEHLNVTCQVGAIVDQEDGGSFPSYSTRHL